MIIKWFCPQALYPKHSLLRSLIGSHRSNPSCQHLLAKLLRYLSTRVTANQCRISVSLLMEDCFVGACWRFQMIGFPSAQWGCMWQTETQGTYLGLFLWPWGLASLSSFPQLLVFLWRDIDIDDINIDINRSRVLSST